MEAKAAKGRDVEPAVRGVGCTTPTDPWLPGVPLKSGSLGSPVPPDLVL